MEAQLEQRLEEVRDEVRQEVVNHLQEQLQVRGVSMYGILDNNPSSFTSKNERITDFNVAKSYLIPKLF